MELYTTVEMPSGLPQLSYDKRLLMMGSCFATGMGRRLKEAKFDCLVNPYGVLYNPLSISTALHRMLDGIPYAAEDLYLHDGCWHSAMHHGDYSGTDREEVLHHINIALRQGHERLHCLDVLIVTLGTARVYEDADTGRVVGNCHKLPERCFRRRLLEVDEVVRDYVGLIKRLQDVRPSVQMLFTVSPIRHIRDGLHANQLSKSVLLLAVDRLCQLFPGTVFYFPSYELMQDELRDYRFYAPDMVHPSEVATDYIWQRFCSACIPQDVQQVMQACLAIGRDLQHRPLHPDSEAYRSFLGQTMLKIERLNQKYPYLDFQKEKEQCLTKLKPSPR